MFSFGATLQSRSCTYTHKLTHTYTHIIYTNRICARRWRVNFGTRSPLRLGYICGCCKLFSREFVSRYRKGRLSTLKWVMWWLGRAFFFIHTKPFGFATVLDVLLYICVCVCVSSYAHKKPTCFCCEWEVVRVYSMFGINIAKA